MTFVPIDAIASLGSAQSVGREAAPMASAPTGAFGRMMLDGIAQVDQQLTQADSLVAAFAVDGSIPPHQVTLALEQARLSLELMMQVRTHLVDGYHELLRMQL